MNNMSLECAINLSYAAVYVLHCEASEIKDENVFRMWRSIFEDLGQLLQDATARQGKSDLSEESVNMLDRQIDWMDDFDTGIVFIEQRSGDATAYVCWSQTFEPEHSVFDDRFVSVMAKLFPYSKRRNHHWRIRRLIYVKKQERERKIAEGGEDSDFLEAIKFILDGYGLASNESERSVSVPSHWHDGDSWWLA